MIPLLPALAANVERRLLINYRVDPAVAATLLPEGLRPQLVDGSAVAGVCLIRLGGLRPAWMPERLGWGGENAAHRVAVEWDDDLGTHQGVYIPIRHSGSWLPVAVGGRIFPGVHRHARFSGRETDDRIRVSLDAADLAVSADVAVVDTWESGLFRTVDDASDFFQNGATGWSPGRDGRTLEGLTLSTDAWHVDAGRMIEMHSSFFDALPAGAATYDSVLVMRTVPITWSVPAVRRFAGTGAATARVG
jgi:hypothetical protein